MYCFEFVYVVGYGEIYDYEVVWFFFGFGFFVCFYGGVVVGSSCYYKFEMCEECFCEDVDGCFVVYE